MYCNYLNVDYAVEVVGRHSYADLVALFMPVLAWLFRSLPTYTYAVIFVSMTCLLSSLFFTYLLLYAVRNVARGRVQDHRVPARPDNPDARQEVGGGYEGRATLTSNVSEVFGELYALAILSPFVRSRLTGDGYSFGGDVKELPKDM